MKTIESAKSNPLTAIILLLLASCILTAVPAAFADPSSNAWTCQSFVMGTWGQRNKRITEWANQHAPNELKLQAAGSDGGSFIYACGR